ncbi:hypothetical protein HN873_015614 [Arachis hypogaea]
MAMGSGSRQEQGRHCSSLFGGWISSLFLWARRRCSMVVGSGSRQEQGKASVVSRGRRRGRAVTVVLG